MSTREKGALIVSLAAQSATTGDMQWVRLIPLGTNRGLDGRGPYTIASKQAAKKVIADTLAGKRGVDLAIDYDHQTDFSAVRSVGGTAPAAGWIKELAARDDGIWAHVEWTSTAAEKLRKKEYRYISPVFAHTKDGTVTRVLRAALTNNPNLELVALSSAEGNMDELDELRQLLGLAADADMSAILTAVRELLTAQQSSAPDPAKYVPIDVLERVTAQLNTFREGVSQQAAENAVAEEIGKGRLPPFLREWGVSLCTVNKTAFDAFVEKTGKGLAHLFTAQNPGQYQNTSGAMSAEEEAVCAALGHDPKEVYGSR